MGSQHVASYNIRDVELRLGRIIISVPWHLTPASSEWPLVQVTVELRGQSVSLPSLPLQATLSKWIGPVPAPK